MKLCDYGCEQEGRYEFKNGKWCCHESQNSCPALIEKWSKSKRGENNPNFGNFKEYEKRKCGNPDCDKTIKRYSVQ